MRVSDTNQDPVELAQFIAFAREIGTKRYLEIGCRNGWTFDAVMRAIGAGGFGLAIDLPENPDSLGNLMATCRDLRRDGIAAIPLFGDSGDPVIVGAAKELGPFDLVLIDGDHRYEGVSRDFNEYAGLAPYVALHDVTAPPGHQSDGHDNDVGRFWNEIKANGWHTREFVTPGSQMGFGILGAP